MKFFVEEYIFFWVPLIQYNFYTVLPSDMFVATLTYQTNDFFVATYSVFPSIVTQHVDSAFALRDTKYLKFFAFKLYRGWVVESAKYDILRLSQWPAVKFAMFKYAMMVDFKQNIQFYKLMGNRTNALAFKIPFKTIKPYRYIHIMPITKLSRWSRHPNDYSILNTDTFYRSVFTYAGNVEFWAAWWYYALYLDGVHGTLKLQHEKFWLGFYYELLEMSYTKYFSNSFHYITSYLNKYYEFKSLFLYKIYLLWGNTVYDWIYNLRYDSLYYLCMFFIIYMIFSDIQKYKLDLMFKCVFFLKSVYHHIRFFLTGFFHIFMNPYHLYVILRKFNDINNGNEKNWKKLKRRFFFKMSKKKLSSYDKFYITRWNIVIILHKFILRFFFLNILLKYSKIFFNKILKKIFWIFDLINIAKIDQFFFKKILEGKNSDDFIKFPFVMLLLTIFIFPFFLAFGIFYLINLFCWFILKIMNKNKIQFSETFISNATSSDFFLKLVLEIDSLYEFDLKKRNYLISEWENPFWFYYFTNFSETWYNIPNRFNEEIKYHLFWDRKVWKESPKDKFNREMTEIEETLWEEYKKRKANENEEIRKGAYKDYIYEKQIQYEKEFERRNRKPGIHGYEYKLSTNWFYTFVSNSLFGFFDFKNRFDMIKELRYEKFYMLLHYNCYDSSYKLIIKYLLQFIKILIKFFKLLTKFINTININFFFINFYYIIFFFNYIIFIFFYIFSKIFYLIKEQDIVLISYYFIFYYSIIKVNCKYVYNLLKENKLYIGNNIFFIFFYKILNYIALICIEIYNLLIFMKDLFYKFWDSKIGLKLWYYLSYTWFIFFTYNILWRIFSIIFYRLIWLFAVFFVLFSVSRYNEFLLQMLYENIIIMFEWLSNHIWYLFEVIFNDNMNAKEYIYDWINFIWSYYYALDENIRLTSIPESVLNNYKIILIQRMYTSVIIAEKDSDLYYKIPYFLWNTYHMIESWGKYFNIYHPHWYYIQWIGLYAKGDMSSFLHNRIIYYSFPGNLDNKLYYLIITKEFFYFFYIHLYYAIEWIWNYGWYYIVYESKIYFLKYFSNELNYQKFLFFLFLIPNVISFLFNFIIYIYNFIFFYFKLYDNLNFFFNYLFNLYLIKIKDYIYIQVLYEYNIARFLFFIDIYLYCVKISYIILYIPYHCFEFLIKFFLKIFSFFLYPWTDNYDLLFLIDVTEIINIILKPFVRIYTNMFEFFLSVYNSNYGMELNYWKEQRNIIYFNTRASKVWENIKIDSMSVFLRTLSFQEEILKDFFYKTNYKRNNFFFMYKIIYYIFIVWGLIFLFSTFSSVFRKLFKFTRYISPSLWNAWYHMNSENFYNLAPSEREYISSWAFRDYFRNYKELFPADPFPGMKRSVIQAHEKDKRFHQLYVLEQRNIEGRDGLLYSILLRILRQSMLFFDKEFLKTIDDKETRKKLYRSSTRTHTLYVLKLLDNYRDRYKAFFDITQNTFPITTKFTQWIMSTFFRKFTFIKRDLSIPMDWYNVYDWSGYKKFYKEPFNWLPIAFNQLRYWERKRWMYRVVLPYISKQSYNGFFVSYFFNKNVNVFLPYIQKFKTIIDLKDWSKIGKDIDFYEFSLYEPKLIKLLCDQFIPSFENWKGNENLQNKNLFYLITAYCFTNLVFIPYHYTPKNDRLRRLFRTNKQNQKIFEIENWLIKMSEFDKQYFSGFFDFDFGYFFRYGRFQQSKISVRDVTNVNVWHLDDGREIVEYLRSEEGVTRDDVELENRRELEEFLQDYFKKSILPTGKYWEGGTINKIATVLTTFKGCFSFGLIYILPFLTCGHLIHEIMFSGSTTVMGNLFNVGHEFFRFFLKELNLDLYLYSVRYLELFSTNLATLMENWVQEFFPGHWSFFFKSYKFNIDKNYLNFIWIRSADSNSYYLWPFKKLIYNDYTMSYGKFYRMYFINDYRYANDIFYANKYNVPTAWSDYYLSNKFFKNYYVDYKTEMNDYMKHHLFYRKKISKLYPWHLTEKLTEFKYILDIKWRIFYEKIGLFNYGFYGIWNSITLDVFLFIIFRTFIALIFFLIFTPFYYILVSSLTYWIHKFNEFSSKIKIK